MHGVGARTWRQILTSVAALAATLAAMAPGFGLAGDHGASSYPESARPSLAADLRVFKVHIGDSFTIGARGTYRFGVINLSDEAIMETLVVVDRLPPGLTFADWRPEDGWSCFAAGQVVTCQRPGPLAAHASTGFDLYVQVGPAAAPSVSNTVSLDSPQDPNPATTPLRTPPLSAPPRALPGPPRPPPQPQGPQRQH